MNVEGFPGTGTTTVLEKFDNDTLVSSDSSVENSTKGLGLALDL